MQPSHVFGGDQYPLSYQQMELIERLKARPRWAIRNVLNGVDSPRYLYKYFSLDPDYPDSIRNLRGVMVDSCLWLSKPSEFNDPFDFRGNFRFSDDPVERRKYFEKSAKKIVGNHPGHRKKRGRVVRTAQDRHLSNPELVNETFLSIRDQHGVCCFSTDPKSLLMWAHYAKAHTGVCLQFEVAQDPEILSLARRVNYEKDFPMLVWPRDKELVVDRVIFRKFDIWRYENERRIAMSNLAERNLRFNGHALTGVICGHRMPEGSRHILAKLDKERQWRGLPSSRTYRCSPNAHKYGMAVSSWIP